MKKLLFAIILFCSSTGIVHAQSEKYLNAMQGNLQAIDSGFKNPAYLLTLANNFERIATAEKNQWLPYYYAAFCQVQLACMEQDKNKIDGIADKATQLINKADSLEPNNSEVSCIKSMIASSHMMVDPMQRYMQYGAESEKQLTMASTQDPTNPRPNFLKGQGLKYTPEQFGGGCKTAKVEFQKAMDKYLVYKPASALTPNWGMDITRQMLEECNAK